MEKTYTLPDGTKFIFEYDHNRMGIITLECMDTLMSLLKATVEQTEPQTCDTCKWGEWYRKGYDITMMSDECGGCCSWNNKWTPKTEPQTDCSWQKGE